MEYKIKFRKGIDDLKSLSPYFGEWSTFIPYYDITEEEYLADPQIYQQRVLADNTSYINQLKDKNEYGVETELAISMQHNPSLDAPINKTKETYPLESYKFLILDV